jgi:competence protein ComEC
MLRYACGALAGTCCVLVAPRLATNVELFAIAAGLGALGLATRCRWLIVCAVAFVVTTVEARARLADWLSPELQSDTLTISGVVASVPQSRAGGTRFAFDVDRDPRLVLPRRVELTWYDAPRAPRAAERWGLEVRLRRPRGFSNPGGPDLAARLLREGVGATGYVRAGRLLPMRPADGWRRPVLRIRARVATSIADALGTRPASGIVTGLAVGLQDALSVEQWRELSRSGTSHLMAISGLHIGMVATLFGWICACIRRWRQSRGSLGAARDAYVIGASVAAVIYSALAGASVPTQRTSIMILVAAAALHGRRNPGPVNGLAVALLLVLIMDPLAPLAPGFWLSFAAVATIVAALDGSLTRPSVVTCYLRTQWAVSIGLVPVLAHAFGNVSLVSAVVNLPAIPLYTLVIVPWVLIGSAAAALDAASGAVLLRPVAWLIESTWPLIAGPAKLELAAWSVARPDFAGWTLLIAGVLGAIAPLPAHARAAALALVCCVCLWQPAPPPVGRARVAVLDVGQGLAVVVRTHAHVLVYDTGPAFRSGSDAAQLVVLPYLQSLGIRSIDALVASHDDSDHTGGARTLLAALPVRARVASGAALDGGRASQRCGYPLRWTWDGVAFEWLNDGGIAAVKDNDRSCVLRIVASSRTLLLPGDVEAYGESRLLEAGRLGRADVVVVPHHGSRSSSTGRFVAATAPRWAIASAGYRNRWGFPRREVVERWQSAGARVVVTAQAGAIEFELGGAAPGTLRSSRQDEQRLWREREPGDWAAPTHAVSSAGLSPEVDSRACSKSSKPAASSWCRSSSVRSSPLQ